MPRLGRASTEVGALELPPAAARRRDAALATQSDEPADQHGDQCDEEAAAERLHRGARWNRTTDLILIRDAL
jgi:hypothetical protein